MTTSPGLSADTADLSWGPVTVRVAWTLLTCGVAIKPEILNDARDHVWFHLDPTTPVSVAEDRAEQLVRAFIGRARGRPVDEPWPQDLDMPLSPRWRSRLTGSLAPLAAWVLRLHYADGVDLQRVAARTGEDLLAVEAAREGLREVVRRAAADDGVPLDGWSEARLDRLMHRLACMAPDGGPSLLEVVEGRHPDWSAHCVRSARALTLVQRGLLDKAQLLPPPSGGRPTDTITVVALHFQREIRGQRRALAKEISAIAVPLGDDMLLVDGADLEQVREVLVLAAEVGAPNRDQLRGAVLRGPGRWSRHGIIGPVYDQAASALRAVPWATVEGLGELPPPLPEPPSARNAWVAVAMLAAVAFVLISASLRPLVPSAVHPLEVESTPGRGGVWVSFDVDEEAYVVVVRAHEHELEVLLDSQHPADKVAWATGDGSYRLHTPHSEGDGLLVASSSAAIADLPALIEAARKTEDPIEALATALEGDDHGADVWKNI